MGRKRKVVEPLKKTVCGTTEVISTKKFKLLRVVSMLSDDLLRVATPSPLICCGPVLCLM